MHQSAPPEAVTLKKVKLYVEVDDLDPDEVAQRLTETAREAGMAMKVIRSAVSRSCQYCGEVDWRIRVTSSATIHTVAELEVDADGEVSVEDASATLADSSYEFTEYADTAVTCGSCDETLHFDDFEKLFPDVNVIATAYEEVEV